MPDKKLEEAGINVTVGEVTELDTAQKQALTADGRRFPYDKLFLATGSSAFIPPLGGRELNGVCALRGLDDAERIKAFLAETKPAKLVFIGAGFISMEIASLLATQNPGAYDITVVEQCDRPLPLMLDKDMAGPVAEYLDKQGIRLMTDAKVEQIVGQDTHVRGVALDSGKIIDADMVFVNVGVRPNVALAEKAGLKMGRFGIQVNRFQETSDPDILAGGDCVEKINFITGKIDAGCLRGPAVMQGRLAAKRLAGFDIGFPGVLNAGGCRMFDLVVASTGLTEETAAREGFETICAAVDSRSKHGMIPGMQPWRIKLVFDRETKKLIGGQIVSHDVAPAREIDAVSAFILGGKTMADLTTFTSACNPDISSEPSMEPITIAAEQALQQSG
ncbi:FAD-dependent oxidoreductase [Desulfatitalea sp. M08but]|uniref:FAD-dependent oxidoreductase n=1 Tax=Desulfatitalea alkaliphila TaxID=2929485 RepID=A0AA41R2V0_9BACT|nr:FAD-dependent oxidoreductase [Desulfatitalea alkaliphila]